MSDPTTQAQHAVLEQIGLLGDVRREMARCADEVLHAGAAGAVVQLARCGPLRPRDLARLMNVDLSVVSRQVAALTAAGQVRREADPTDGRACLVSLTPAGHAALDALRDRVLDRFRAELSAFDPDELRELTERLRRLRAALLPAVDLADRTADRTPALARSHA